MKKKSLATLQSNPSESSDIGEVNKDRDDEEEEAKKRKQILCLPYVKGLSEKIEKECKVIEPCREVEAGLPTQ